MMAKIRCLLADDLESAKVLIRRAAARAGLGIDVVPTVAPDGRDALAYLAREKRVREPKSDTAADNATVDQADTTDDGMESYDDDESQED